MAQLPAGEPVGAPAAGGVWAPSRRRLTASLVLTVTLVAFEALAIATVLPVVARQLGDIELYGWVFSSFLLASLIGIVVAGTLADRTPPVRPMLGGLALFAAGLAAGGTAHAMPVLVAARAMQGLGAGVVPATAYVVISRAYPPGCHPRMFAVLSTAWVVPGLVGPAIAAGVAAAFGWRWVFLGLLPLVAAAAMLAAVALRDVPPPRPGIRPVVPSWPVAGIVSGAGSVLASLGSGSPPVLAAGALLGGGLLAASLRRLTPPGTLSARRGLPATVLSRGLLTFSFFAGDAYVPYLVTTVRHSPTVLAGLALTAGTISWSAATWVQARAVGRVGPRRLVRSGEALVLVALGALALVLLPAVPPAVAVAAWTIGGAGMGLAYSPLAVATLDRAPAGEEGRAASGLQVTDVLGQALGAGAAGVLVAAGAHGLGARAGVGLAFAMAVAVSLLALAVGARLPDRLLRRG